jgi:hypothetical protein
MPAMREVAIGLVSVINDVSYLSQYGVLENRAKQIDEWDINVCCRFRPSARLPRSKHWRLWRAANPYKSTRY